MKPRLIDANELVIETKKCLSLCETFKGYTAEDALKHFLLLIDERPTAYDIDKVVEQLCEIEVHRNEYSETVECNIEPCRGMSCYECIVDKAIEIVKGNCCKNGNSSECVGDVNKTLKGGAE